MGKKGYQEWGAPGDFADLDPALFRALRDNITGNHRLTPFQIRQAVDEAMKVFADWLKFQEEHHDT